MSTKTPEIRQLTIPARDGYPLAARVFGESSTTSPRVVIINSATAPVLAYSFGDDKWGTPRSVNAMMRAYPNVERRHVEPSEVGLGSIGHLGFFKLQSEVLWNDTLDWLDRF